MASPFDPRFEDLPRIIPVFPLHGCLLLPRGHLPLNIFEPRYLAMTRDAVAGERIIGMIQPTGPEDRLGEPALYGTGCAGRITSFSETTDGRYTIGLNGLCRFDIVEELPIKDGYRRVVADFHRYRHDMAPEPEVAIDRERLMNVLRSYFDRRNIPANWQAIEKAEPGRLIVQLAMACPFSASEKQALLEAPDASALGQAVMTLLEMASLESEDGPATSSH